MEAVGPMPTVIQQRYRRFLFYSHRFSPDKNGKMQRVKDGGFIPFSVLAEANNRIATLAEGQSLLIKQMQELRDALETRELIEMDIVREGILIKLPNTDFILKLIANEEGHYANVNHV